MSLRLARQVVISGCERKMTVVINQRRGRIGIVADDSQAQSFQSFSVQVFVSSANGRKCVGSHAYTEYRHVAQSFALPICRRGPT
jgi:hypothetical protein